MTHELVQMYNINMHAYKWVTSLPAGHQLIGLHVLATWIVWTSNVDQTIHNAKDLYDKAQEHLAEKEISSSATLHKRRFFYVEKESVLRDRDVGPYSTLPSTRKLHSVQSVNVDGNLNIRYLSCYCFPCLTYDFKNCENIAYVSPFKVVNFGGEQLTADPSNNYATDTEEPTNEVLHNMYNLVCKGSFIAIKPGTDSLYDYHLFQVESEGIITITDETSAPSDFNYTFALGDEVVVGHYYNYQKTTREGCLYKLDQRTATIPKQSIVYVGIDVTPSQKKSSTGLYVLQTVDHEDILCSL